MFTMKDTKNEWRKEKKEQRKWDTKYIWRITKTYVCISSLNHAILENIILWIEFHYEVKIGLRLSSVAYLPNIGITRIWHYTKKLFMELGIHKKYVALGKCDFR